MQFVPCFIVVCFVFPDSFTLCVDWEPCSLHVLHARDGAVWRHRAEAGGAAAPLVQHGNHAGAARDTGEHQGGDPTTGGSGLTGPSSFFD